MAAVWSRWPASSPSWPGFSSVVEAEDGESVVEVEDGLESARAPPVAFTLTRVASSSTANARIYRPWLQDAGPRVVRT